MAEQGEVMAAHAGGPFVAAHETALLQNAAQALDAYLVRQKDVLKMLERSAVRASPPCRPWSCLAVSLSCVRWGEGRGAHSERRSLTPLANVRIEYYRQLQRLSDNVRMLEIDPAAIPRALDMAIAESASTQAPLAKMAGRVRYLDNLARRTCPPLSECVLASCAGRLNSEHCADLL